MAECTHCKVNIKTACTRCPLCGAPLSESGTHVGFPKVSVSPTYAHRLNRIWYSVMALFLFSIVFDAATAHSFWYLVASLGVIAAAVGAISSIEDNQNFGYTVFRSTLLLAGVALAVDYRLGFSGWSLDYALPFLGLGGNLLLAIILFLKPILFREYFLYQLGIGALTASTLLLYFFGAASLLWPAVVSALGSLFSAVLLVIFYGRRSKHEVSKRMHF